MASDRKRKTNRLIRSGNPYLLQHARNPVDWYPWSSEAFTKAAAENKPVFLSIGYSTCHWCHVMEAESFSDPEVAALMNETFVSIKVDREERPDLDHIYMAACKKLTGNGGWPLTIIMAPDKKPFFAGTYFPKEGNAERMGMLQLIPKVKELWTKRKGKAQAVAEEVLVSLQASLSPGAGGRPRKKMVEEAFTQIVDTFDRENGGFGIAPKFPVPVNLFFLLRYWRRTGKVEALDMCRQTLRAIRHGGIYDHLGYGVHRYSTDRKWLIPHFEKMLYDQALIAMACTETFQASGEEEFRDMAREIFLYTLRDLKSPDGGFYSGEDADSEGKKGRFYTWTAAEIDRILDGVEHRVARAVFHITKEGNEKTAIGNATGRNILHFRAPLTILSKELDLPLDRLRDILGSVHKKMLEARSSRPRPFMDTKIMTDWNGLMIAALAKAAGAFDEPLYADAAETALAHVLETMRGDGGQLYHVRCGKEASVPAFLDDYAYLLWGMMELFQSTFKIKYFTGAVSLADEMLSLFWDDSHDGLYFSPRGSGPLPLRHKFANDGVMPSGNAVAAINLLRIGRLNANPVYEEKTAAIGKAFSGVIEGNPASYSHLISVFNMAFNPGAQVIIIGDPSKRDTLEMISAYRRTFCPNSVAAFIPYPKGTSTVGDLIYHARDVRAFNGQATAYVCEDFLCRAPTTDPDEMVSSIMEIETEGR